MLMSRRSRAYPIEAWATVSFGLVCICAFCTGFLCTEIAAWLNSPATYYEFMLGRGSLVGAVYALVWALLVPLVASGGVVRSLLLGAVSWFLACVVSVVGIWAVFYIFIFWYVFIPAGVFLGGLTWLLTRRSTAGYRKRQEGSKQVPLRTETGAAGDNGR